MTDVWCIFLILLWHSASVYSECQVGGNVERPEWALLNSTSLSVINSTEDGSGFQQVDNSTDNEGNWMVIVSNDADNGYGVDIVIKNVFLDPEYDEYVLIAPGTSKDSVAVQIVTGNINGTFRYRITNTNGFFVKYFVFNATEKPKFILTYERSGSLLTTVSPATEDPNPPDSVDKEYKVMLVGKNVNEYTSEVEAEIKEGIKNISRKYCTEHNITFEEKTPEDMVRFIKVSQCPEDYPDSRHCVFITHSVYVSGYKNSYRFRATTTYELTKVHLEEMWRENEDIFSAAGVKVYYLPETSDTILIWVLCVAIALIIIAVGFIVFRRVRHYFQPEKQQGPNEIEIQDGVTIRRKYTGLKPSEHQTIPKFMVTEPEITLRRGKSQPKSKPPKPGILKTPPPDFSDSSEQRSPETSNVAYFGGLHFNCNRNELDEEIGADVREHEKGT